MSEIIRVKATSANLPMVLSNLIASHKLIENRDIGDFVGMPINEQLRARPFDIRLTIFFFSEKEPPFTPQRGKRYVRATYNISDPKRASLDWNKIKTACGGENGYMWGRFSATGHLSNQRQLRVYGETGAMAQERLMAFALLSTAEITSLIVSEEKKEGKRKTGELLYKEATRIYPAYFAVVNSQKIAIESKLEKQKREDQTGKVLGTLSGTFLRHRTEKIPLWIKTEPILAREQIKEALRVRTK